VHRVKTAAELFDIFPETCLKDYNEDMVQDLIDKQEIYRTPTGYIRLFNAKEGSLRYLVVDSVIPYIPADVSYLRVLAEYAKQRGFDDFLLKTSISDCLSSFLEKLEPGTDSGELLEDILIGRSDYFPMFTRTVEWESELPLIYKENRRNSVFTACFISLY
jgi:hypothetical protein